MPTSRYSCYVTACLIEADIMHENSLLRCVTHCISSQEINTASRDSLSNRPNTVGVATSMRPGFVSHILSYREGRNKCINVACCSLFTHLQMELNPKALYKHRN
jgi:hypothetical protein